MFRRALTAIVVLSFAAPAFAQTDSPALPGGPSAAGSFGSKGTLSLSSDIGGQLGYESVGGNGAFVLTLKPAADYFIVDHFSVGGVIGLSLTAASGATATNFIIEPRAGYQLALMPKLDLWPRLGLQLTTGDAALGNVVIAGAGSQTTFGVVIDAPLLYKPAGHFYFGVAPTLIAQFVGDAKTVGFTFDFIIGGWL